ncbi:MAG: rhomboid family intramembrane serine protease [Marinilabiliales bacterium]|nr:rhomboid family intramembrane serine protease [Marinilabiliales bacterium]
MNTAVFLFQAAAPQGLEMAALRVRGRPLRHRPLPPPPRPAAFPPLLTLLTSMFLHGSLFHLARQHALPLDLRQQHRGPARARSGSSCSTSSCGVAAALTHILFEPGSRVPMIGASGAIAGVLGAYWPALSPGPGQGLRLPHLLHRRRGRSRPGSSWASGSSCNSSTSAWGAGWPGSPISGASWPGHRCCVRLALGRDPGLPAVISTVLS